MDTIKYIGPQVKDVSPGKILGCRFYLTNMNSLKNYPKLEAEIKIEGQPKIEHRSRGFIAVTPEEAMETLIKNIKISLDENIKQQLILQMNDWLKNNYSKVSSMINVDRLNKKEKILNSGNYWKTSIDSNGDSCLPLLQYNSKSELVRSEHFNMGSHKTIILN
uniref:Uncharacterized protein n=1 Tax=viral metagenome TaxID=1070528 RepID=A0A6C0EP81_9ZZZZ